MAITGKAFEYIVHLRDIDTGKTTNAADNLRKVIRNAKVFARMSPEGKASLVTELQNETKEMIAMCGDGANDCNALKAADVGLSLSEAEASIAAPFTSKIPDISPMITLFKEGRASLTTSFTAFKFIELYSMIMFCNIIILYRIAGVLGDMQYLFIDIFIIIPFTILMGYTGANDKLSKKIPTGALISIPVLCSVMGQVFIMVLFQVAVFLILRAQSWYHQLEPYGDRSTECQENTVTYFFALFQYIYVVITFSIGKPFRKPMYTNYFLCIDLVLVLTM